MGLQSANNSLENLKLGLYVKSSGGEIPPGFVSLQDDEGNILIDDEGNILIAPE